MTIVYVLLALGWFTSMFVLWCVLRSGKLKRVSTLDIIRAAPARYGSDELEVYLMQREARRTVNPEWDQLAEEEVWRIR